MTTLLLEAGAYHIVLLERDDIDGLSLRAWVAGEYLGRCIAPRRVLRRLVLDHNILAGVPAPVVQRLLRALQPSAVGQAILALSSSGEARTAQPDHPPRVPALFGLSALEVPCA